MLPRDTLLTKALSYLANLALRKADNVVAIGRCMVERLKAKGISTARIHMIPNWVDTEQVYPIDGGQNPLRREWGLEDKFVVLYSGNMGLSHDFDDILEVARELEHRQDIAFVFVGGGTREKEVRDYVSQHDLRNVLFFPFQDIGRLAYSLSVGDVHFVVLRENCTGLAVPSKSYGVLAAGRPMIYQGSQEGEIAQMIVEQQIGTTVSCGDRDGLKRAIVHYVDHPNLRLAQGRKARKLVEGPYGQRRALDLYRGVFLGVPQASCSDKGSHGEA
jgi:glycosyltransferase involved in cell wall biosynthesis